MPSLHDTKGRPVTIYSLHGFVRSDSLDDQISHAKAFLPHYSKHQILMEEKMTQSCQTCTTW
jgi:hypothetical protein